MTRQDLAECIKAPRTNIVRFPYGAPTGAPGDYKTQRGVVMESLLMLENSEKTPQMKISEYRWNGAE